MLLRNLFIIISVFIISEKATAQSFDKGDNIISGGYGFPDLFRQSFYNNISSKSSPYGEEYYSGKVEGSGPYFFKYEHSISPLLGLGLVIGFSPFKSYETHDYRGYFHPSNQYYHYADHTTSIYNSWSFGFRSNIHVLKKERIDLYFGIAGGYTYTSYAYTTITDNPRGALPVESHADELPNGVYLSTTIGLRYYFSNNIGIFTELGFDKYSLIQGGLVFKF